MLKKKTQTFFPVYVLNSDTRVHFNCIIVFSALTGEPPSAAASTAAAVVACLLHRTLKFSAETQDPRNSPESYGICDISTFDIEWR